MKRNPFSTNLTATALLPDYSAHSYIGTTNQGGAF